MTDQGPRVWSWPNIDKHPRFHEVMDEMKRALEEGRVKLHGPNSLIRGMYEGVERPVITSFSKLPEMSPEEEKAIREVYGLLTDADNPNNKPFYFYHPPLQDEEE